MRIQIPPPHWTLHPPTISMTTTASLHPIIYHTSSSSFSHFSTTPIVVSTPTLSTMAATVVVAAGTMLIGTKSATSPPKLTTATPTKPSPTFLPLQNLPKGLAFASHPRPSLPSLTSSAIAAVVFSSLSSADAAFAVQQIADIADGDSRGLALLIPIVPAIGWVLYNILQLALNQINKMRSVKGIAVGLGLGLGFGLGLTSAPIASAGDVATIAEAASGDNRGLLLLVPVAVAIAWVLFNILQPALNQLNKMRSG